MNARHVDQWMAIARSDAVKTEPLRVMVGGQPLVLFRSAGQLHCLTDYCPHRAAPLSGGKIKDGLIECPYHGWRFDGAGRCKLIPGHIGVTSKSRVPVHLVMEKDGLIFYAEQMPTLQPYTTALSAQRHISVISENNVSSTVAEVAENILDATHTHFVHKGILRGLSSRRYKVTVSVTGGDGWVEARYEGEPQQEGIISRLLEGKRSISIGRFMAPGIAELEFWGPSQINLVTSFHLRQATPDQVHGFGILSAHDKGILSRIKAMLFKPFFQIAVRQDQKILESAQKNRAYFPARTRMIGPIDVMRPHIEAILAGNRPSVADQPLTLTIEL